MYVVRTKLKVTGGTDRQGTSSVAGLFLQPTLMHNSIKHVCQTTILDMFRALTRPSSGGTTAHTHTASGILALELSERSYIKLV